MSQLLNPPPAFNHGSFPTRLQAKTRSLSLGAIFGFAPLQPIAHQYKGRPVVGVRISP